MKYRLNISPEVINVGNLIQDESRTVTISNPATVPAELRYQGLLTTGGVYTTPVSLPHTLNTSDAQPFNLGISTDGPLRVNATLQLDWHFDVDDQVAAKGGYGPMIYNGLIVNAYHPEVGRGGYFHPNSGTSEGQGVMILACFLAYEVLRGDPATEETANYYRDLAINMLNAMSEFDHNGPMLRQPIPDNPNTITLLHWLFAAKGPVSLQQVVLDYEVTVSGSSVTIPAADMGEGVVLVYKLYPADKQLLYPSPFSPVVGGGEVIPTGWTENTNGSLTINLPAGVSGPYKVVYAHYTSQTLPLGSAYEAFPVWSPIPDGYAACAPDTFRWFDMALNKAIELGIPRDASKWRKLRDALRMTVVKGQNLSDLREVLKPMPLVEPFATDGVFCFSDNSQALAPAPGSGLDPGWTGYNFFRRDRATGYIVAEVPLSSTAPTDTAFSTTQFGRGFDDSWRTSTAYQEADQYLLLEMAVRQDQNVTSIYTDEPPNFRPFISTTREYDPTTRYYAEADSAEAGGVPSWDDLGQMRSLLYPRTAFKNSLGATFPAGGRILNFGIEMKAPATIGYTVTLGLMRLVSGPSAAWVRDNLAQAKKGSKLPYFPGAIPFATNADLNAQEFVGYNGNPFHGYQLPDLWLELEKEAELVHPILDSNSLPTANPNTGEFRYPIDMQNDNGTPKPAHLALMEQQLLFLRDAADVWFRDHGYRGPFAHTFVLNTPARHNIGSPAPHTWVYTNDDPNTRWVGYQVRIVESLAYICFRTRDDEYAEDSYNLSKTLLVNWLTWLNGAWPNLSGSPYKGMPTDFDLGSVQTLYEETHAPAIVLRACLYLKLATDEHDVLCDALIQRCWDYLELNWRTTGEMAYTWSPDPANRQWYGFWHGEIIWTLAVMLGEGASAVPATIDPAVVRSRLVLTQGWLETHGVLDARHRMEVPVTGFRAAMLGYDPNWQDGYQVSRSYRTDIFTSNSGEQQRRALRETPRKSIEFSVFKTREQLREFQTVMSVWHNRDFTAPELTRFQRLATGAMAGSYQLVLPVIPEWLVPGSIVILTERNEHEIHEVESVLGQRVYLTAALQKSWSAGTKVCHGVTGHLQSDFNTDRHTSDVMTGVLALDVLPGSERYPTQFEVPPNELFPNLTEYPDMAPVAYVPVNSTKLHFHDGEDIFVLRNNWGENVDEGYEWPVNPVDYDRGVIQWDWDINFTTRSARMTVLCHTPERIAYMEQFFDRMRGAQGNFWMPTWENDLPIAGNISGETYSLTVSATRTIRLLLDNPIFRDIAVVTKDDRVFTNSILDAIFSGETVTLTLRDPWLEDIRADQVRMISWLPSWRLTSDEMVFTWLTDTVAQVVLECQTDKAERYDPDDVANLRRAIIFTSKPYPLFFEDRLSARGQILEGELRDLVKHALPNHHVSASAVIIDGRLREPVVFLEPEHTVVASAEIVEATLRTPLVTVAPVHTVGASAQVVDGTLEVKLVTASEGDTVASTAEIIDGSLQ